MSEPEKFCVDCRHHQEAHCMRAPQPNPSEIGAWLVTGQGTKPPAWAGFYLCQIERTYNTETCCGPSGRFFEAKT